MRVERLDPSVAIDTPRYLCSSIGDEGYDGYRDTEALGVVGARTRVDLWRAVMAPPGHENEHNAMEWARAEMAARGRAGKSQQLGMGLGVLFGDLNRRFMQSTKAEGNAGSDTPR